MGRNGERKQRRDKEFSSVWVQGLWERSSHLRFRDEWISRNRHIDSVRIVASLRPRLASSICMYPSISLRVRMYRCGRLCLWLPMALCASPATRRSGPIASQLGLMYVYMSLCPPMCPCVSLCTWPPMRLGCSPASANSGLMAYQFSLMYPYVSLSIRMSDMVGAELS